MAKETVREGKKETEREVKKETDREVKKETADKLWQPKEDSRDHVILSLFTGGLKPERLEADKL